MAVLFFGWTNGLPYFGYDVGNDYLCSFFGWLASMGCSILGIMSFVLWTIIRLFGWTSFFLIWSVLCRVVAVIVELFTNIGSSRVNGVVWFFGSIDISMFSSWVVRFLGGSL